MAQIDALLSGGIVRGRIAEIVGPTSAGKTSLAACFAASATRRGEVIAWIDAGGTFDPATIAAAGVDLGRALWIHAPTGAPRGSRKRPPGWNVVRAAELVLAAGGFGLVVVDFASHARPIPLSAALRLARIAERTGAAVLALATARMCGTFAAQSLALCGARACFRRAASGAPTLFDGMLVDTRIARNKFGGVGARTDVLVARS